MKRFILITVLCGIMLSVQIMPLRAQGRGFDEYEVKAVFLANFFKFVEWPTHGRYYRLCIYGSDPFGEHVKILDGMKIRGKTLEIRRPVSVRAVNDCNVLFISSSERRRIHALLDAIRGLDLLTVGDTEGYAQEGVMVNFYIEASKVKFEINLDSIKRSRIGVSSQLLKLGRVVDHE
ncbi:MAG: YfiR family protein [Syntrophorhabdaceae bacterium]|nr:YfiR family protein [Syntrophorhabdaceae bacterium]